LKIDTTITESDEEKFIEGTRVQFNSMNEIAKKIQDVIFYLKKNFKGYFN